MPLQIDTGKADRFRAMLAGKQHVLILAHKNPDGDAVGSMLGLAWMLKKHAGLNDEQLSLLLPNACPESLGYLPGFGRIRFADRELEHCTEAFAKADLVIGVDFNNAPRVGILQEALEQCSVPKILIDHHHQPDEQLFSLLFSEVDLSSACELVYWVGRAVWGEECLSLESAQCLYNGLKTDTGSFAFSNDSPTLYEAAAAMVQFPIHPAAMHNELFNDFSVRRLRFFAFCLSERMKVWEEKGFAYIHVSRDDMSRFQVDDTDTEGLVNYTLLMRPVQVGVLVKETSAGVRLSLRSKREFDVNQFARQHFEGGGHTKAAGGNSPLSLEATCAKLESLILPLL